MSKNYINVYNNLINYSRNKDLYKSLDREDNFSDRLTVFLIHFAFFLKTFKNKENKDILQKIYDFNFRQLELSIREIGYGDQSINKKMKDYINLKSSTQNLSVYFLSKELWAENQRIIANFKIKIEDI